MESVHDCSTCGKSLASRQSLWNHKQKCAVGLKSHHVPPINGQKRASMDEIPTFDGSEFGTGKPKSNATLNRMESIHGGTNAGYKGPFKPLLSSRYDKNPKIQNLVHAVINDNAGKRVTEKKDDFQFGFNSMEASKEANKRFSKAETKKKKLPTTEDIDFGFKTMEEAEKANELLVRKENDDDDDDTDDDDDASMGTTTTTEDSDDDDDDELPQPPPEVVNEVFHSMIESMPRTKEDITGWCSEEEDEDPKIEDLGPLAKELYNRSKI